jgi:hypothetical protein
LIYLPRPTRADDEAGKANKVSNQSSGKICGAAAIYNMVEYLDERKAALEAPGRYIVYRAPLCASTKATSQPRQFTATIAVRVGD